MTTLTEPAVDEPRTDAPAPLAADHLRLAYEGRVVAEQLSVAIPAGGVTAVVGPNACGKSTLLRALARLLRPQAGTVLLDGADIRRLGTRELATRLSILPQSPALPGGIVVADLVGRGRHPHQRLLRQWTAEDDAAVAEALELTGTTELADRPVDELSGGQRQRVWIAMVLAQDTDVVLLDEPTTFLDLPHQLEVLELLELLGRERGRTVVAVLHDLNQAARYADHMIALKDGRVEAAGPPVEVVTEELVARVFGVDARIVPDPVAGTPMVVPVGRRRG